MAYQVKFGTVIMAQGEEPDGGIEAITSAEVIPGVYDSPEQAEAELRTKVHPEQVLVEAGQGWFFIAGTIEFAQNNPGQEVFAIWYEEQV